METKYSFRKRLEQVHAFSRDPAASPDPGEAAVDDSWEIVISGRAGPVLATAADDLRDYFRVAMGVRLRVRETDLCAAACSAAARRILIGTAEGDPSAGMRRVRPGVSRILCDGAGIRITGADEKQAARAGYALERMLTLRKGPFLKAGEWPLVNRFSPRMVHSGWGLDCFPDAYLRVIAHAGFDSILVYYKRADAAAPEKIAEVEDLIRRASRFGLGVYLYFQNWRDYDTLHPAEPGAERYYDGFYGRAFRNHPGAAGCILVGESCSFPSRDPGVRDIRGGEPSGSSKPHPGWWPCSDYAQWLALVQKVITRHKPDADIVFWTYNWGWAPEAKRLALIRSLPAGISLLVTFEMFEWIRKGSMLEPCADYTIKITGPGGYFASEARAAKKRGLRLYAMSNTGGLTWDCGVVPYIPVPFQWAARWKKLLEAQRRWGLSGLMESHHYGWHPSPVAELGIYFSTDPKPDRPGRFLREAAESRFGRPAASRLLQAWRIWSRSIGRLPATGYDQYGPLRVGPSYPLHVSKDDAPNLPSDPGASHGSSIVTPFYAPEDSTSRGPYNAIPAGLRVAHELRQAKRLEAAWQRGVRELEQGLAAVPKGGRAEYVRLLALGEFFSRTLRTLVNTKRWWILRIRLQANPSGKSAAAIRAAMRAIAADEIANAEAMKMVVARDSRLGWEPTMGYLTDGARLDWKIKRLKRVVRRELVS